MSRGKRMRAPEVVRRSRTPRLDLTTVLAVVIPLVTVGLLALVRIPPVHDTDQPPSLTKLTNALVVCPSGRPGSTDAAVSTASGASGDLSVLAGGQQESVPVTTGATSPVDSQDALVVRGSDALAPGLVGLRSGSAPLGALACTVPSPEQWFTGVGSRADHDSVVELVNPDAGAGRRRHHPARPPPVQHRSAARHPDPGAQDDHRRPGQGDPAQDPVHRPRRRLARPSRGGRPRLRRPTWSPIAPPGSGCPVSSRLPPPTSCWGFRRAPVTRTLQLANPSDNVVRAQVKVVTADTSFTPNGLAPVSVPPGATVRVPLSAVLDKALGDGALGLSVVADEPLTASLVTTLDKDRVITVPAADVQRGGRDTAPGRDGRGPRSRTRSRRGCSCPPMRPARPG